MSKKKVVKTSTNLLDEHAAIKNKLEKADRVVDKLDKQLQSKRQEINRQLDVSTMSKEHTPTNINTPSDFQQYYLSLSGPEQYGLRRWTLSHKKERTY